eukprot:CAMPEP_0170311862 /NCGR_PEP_ID=MMETSP0116_2-20130129/56448_1 /TAXON_ID=400756 /ORGANISM="Durinskia baltica, Strain CSIRO CS-38" /LENGTH=95 /DNA_ID=CAMNT_0010564199 /DNA_START=38 /DNA_END=322 /DNA_ORIENTATION=+
MSSRLGDAHPHTRGAELDRDPHDQGRLVLHTLVAIGVLPSLFHALEQRLLVLHLALRLLPLPLGAGCLALRAPLLLLLPLALLQRIQAEVRPHCD